LELIALYIDCTCTVGCGRPGWRIRRNEAVYVTDRRWIVTANTVAECLDYCVRGVSCVGVDVDYNVNPKLCWMIYDRSHFVDRNIIGQTGTDSYELFTRCATPTTTTTAPAVPG